MHFRRTVKLSAPEGELFVFARFVAVWGVPRGTGESYGCKAHLSMPPCAIPMMAPPQGKGCRWHDARISAPLRRTYLFLLRLLMGGPATVC